MELGPNDRRLAVRARGAELMLALHSVGIDRFRRARSALLAGVLETHRWPHLRREQLEADEGL